MLSGDLSLEGRAEVANHAAGCAPCHAALEALLRSHAVGTPADPMGSTLDAEHGDIEVMAEPDEAPAHRRHELAAGDRVHRYVIETVLGRGGMGVVYRARDPELGRAVAIKVLQHGTGGGERLLREAKALAKLSHPNVVTVHDVGTHDGQPFIAMALVEGQTLRQWLATPRTQRAVLDVLLAAGRGIAAAHEAGLIHRDLKPDNIFVAHNGQVQVGDFGLVRGIDLSVRQAAVSTREGGLAPDGLTPDELAPDELTSGELAPWLTRSGMMLGTPAYMAPEQAIGAATTASDQFSFCVTAWEAFTGARPFAGTTATEIIANIWSGLIIEPESERALPPRIDAALRRGLAADPEQRFPSMAALLSALQPTQRTHEVTPAPWAAPGDLDDHEVGLARAPRAAPAVARVIALRTGWRRTIRLAGLAALVMAAASAAVWTAYWASRGPASPPRSRPPAPALAGMIWFPGGTFRMGRTAEEVERECQRLGAACRRDLLDREQPAREVTLSPFYLDALEATNEDVARWLHMMTPSVEMRMDDEEKLARWVYIDGKRILDLMPPYAGVIRTPDGDFVARPGDEHKPIGQITWDGASLYCKGRGKRLPTEAEWERAARGRTARRFPWGEQEPACDQVAWGRLAGMPCALRSREPSPVDVGTAPLDRTPEGVRDLGGNVMEWVQDQFLKPYLPECGKCVDPVVEAPVPLHEDMRVMRGGSWPNGWELSRSTVRVRWKRTEVMVNAGVRCASR